MRICMGADFVPNRTLLRYPKAGPLRHDTYPEEIRLYVPLLPSRHSIKGASRGSSPSWLWPGG